jgi:hypothetical protein
MQNFAVSRGIRNVVHFTRLTNLSSILQHGIVPRQTLVNTQMAFDHNDAWRHDGYLQASCFTIGWPNYKMFFPLRCENPDVKWAVIECSPSVLWEKQCIFSPENAASHTARSVGEAQRVDVTGITAMFAEVVGKPTRAEIGLADFHPTNPQAEVLVCDVVEPRYFLRIHIQDGDARREFSSAYAHVEFTWGWEGARFDYSHWR